MLPRERIPRLGATLLELLVAILVTGIVVGMAFQILGSAYRQSSRRDREQDRLSLVLQFHHRLDAAIARHHRICPDPGRPADGSLERVRDSLSDWLGGNGILIQFECEEDPSGRIPSAIAWRLRVPEWHEDLQGRKAR